MAIEIVTYFDSKQTDDLNNQLLLFELNHFKCHLIEMALTGECKDFIASDTPQKLFSIFWTNAIVFSPQQIIYYKEFTFFNSNDKICWAKRLTDNEFKKEYSYKDIEQKSFSIRYKNFIMSPRSHWIYLTV